MMTDTLTQNRVSPQMAGLSVVLKPTTYPSKSIPLEQWLVADALPEDGNAPRWVSLRRDRGVTKTMPILLKPEGYGTLLQNICQQLATPTVVEWKGKSYDISGVEVEPDDCYVLHLTLHLSKPLPPTIGRAIHALFYKWISAADEAIAQSLHQSTDRLPVSLGTRSLAPKKLELRIALVDKMLLSPLLWGLSQDLGKEISITKVPCSISPHVELVTSSGFEKLHSLSPQKEITLDFKTPTSFKQGKKRIQPFLLPELVFSGLRKRWNAFAPEHLKIPFVEEWTGFVAAYDLKTHALRMERGPEKGAQGWVTYEFPDPEQAKLATVLAHFAFFAGVGRKTAMGMGQTRVRS